MNKLVSTIDLPHEEWLRYRRMGIGGSDIGAILGLNPYRTALDVYLDKVGESDKDEENDFQKWGKRLEPVIADEFAERHPEYKVQRINAILQSDKSPIFLANVDRLIIGADKRRGVLEIKNTGEYKKDQWSDNNIPDMHMAQFQWYLGVMDLQWGYVAVLIGGNKYQDVLIDRNDELINTMFARAQEFWDMFVIRKQAPMPTYQDTETLKEMFPNSIDNAIELPTEAADAIAQMQTAEEAEEQARQIKEEAKNKLKMWLADNDTGLLDKWKVTWKKSKDSVAFDDKLFAQENPGIYRMYTKPKPGSRRFLVKELSQTAQGKDD